MQCWYLPRLPAQGILVLMLNVRCWFLLVVLSFAVSSGFAADEPKAAEKKDEKKKDENEEKLVETKHTITIGGKALAYTAKAGTIMLRDRENKAVASIFYIAYTLDGVTNRASRPVTFSFNGGPGSSSVWLHMGVLGPKRVLLEDDGSPLPPPYQMVDNDYSILDETDLVFIDPVSTGYSRAVKPDDAKKYHGVQEDLTSVGEFIRLYTTRNDRWTSPKFIIGESYGTTRAAGLSGELSDRHRMNVNGIMLVSTVLNFQTLSFAPMNDLPCVLFLPTYTAAAWYHKKLPEDLQKKPLNEVLAEAESFASGEYNQALLQGSGLSADARKNIVAKLARFTGLSQDYIERADLRISIHRFTNQLLASEGKVVGRFDSRYKGFIRDRLSETMEYDPSGEAVFSAYASTFNHYVRSDLKFESDLPYEILTGVGPWNWNSENRYLNVAETLAYAITRNPFLKVHVASGFFDLATPYYATRYTFNHLAVNPELRKNISMDDYTAGHMMYLNLPDLKKQKADLARFIQSAVKK
jgi:carboxypeptidase C (cathepsin A)